MLVSVTSVLGHQIATMLRTATQLACRARQTGAVPQLLVSRTCRNSDLLVCMRTPTDSITVSQARGFAGEAAQQKDTSVRR